MRASEKTKGQDEDNKDDEVEIDGVYIEEERKRILMWKPPWYAGGKALF